MDEWYPQKRVSMEVKVPSSHSTRDEKYPSEYVSGKITDAKQIKTAVEKLANESEISEERLHTLTRQYLIQLGDNLSTQAIEKRRSSSTFDHHPIFESYCLIGTPLSAVNSYNMSTKQKIIHKRRPDPPQNLPLSVPSHIVQKSPQPPERGNQKIRETLTTLLRNRAIRSRQKKAKQSRSTFGSLDNEGQIEEGDQLPEPSLREVKEQRLIAEGAQAEHKWHTFGMKRLRAKVQIVVVGAGLAGLSAAADLLNRGFSDIVILEASDRVGGRMHSVCLYDANKRDTEKHESAEVPVQKNSQYAELGTPEWVCTDQNHTVYELAKERQLITENHPLQNSQCQVITEDGRLLDQIVVLSALRFCAHLERDTQILASNQHGSRSSLAYSDYTRVRRRHLLAGLSKDQENDLALAVDSISTIWRLASGDSKGDKAADLKMAHNEIFHPLDIDIPFEKTARSLISFHKFSCGLHMEKLKQVPKVSFQSTDRLVDSFMKRFPLGMVKLQKRVCCVDWSSFCERPAKDGSARKVKIVCDDGKVYRADHVIMAVPPGHLKKFADRMFTPSLPRYKTDAINTIGVGTVSKILFYYHHPPWKQSFHLIWAGKAGKKKEDTDYTSDSLTSCCLQLVTLNGKLGVLEVTLLGEMPDAAAKDDAHVEREISFILKTFLNKPSSKPVVEKAIPPPDKIIRSSWGKDPLYNGSHPYPKRGCEKRYIDRLASSVNFEKLPVIQFAGDYTWPDYTHLMHAARSSGLREAERLSNAYDNYFGYDNKNPFHTDFESKKITKNIRKSDMSADFMRVAQI